MEKMGFATLAADVSVRSHLPSLQLNNTWQVMDGIFQLMAADGKEHIDYIRYEVVGQRRVCFKRNHALLTHPVSLGL
jgi:hypothetical protein